MTVALQVEQHSNSLRKQDSLNEHCRSPDKENLIRANQSYSSLSELPDYDYPTPIFVRNTFIDIPIARPVSLDEFMQQRKIHSCPPETLDSPNVESLEEAQALWSNSHGAETSSATLLTVAANNAAVVGSRVVSSFHNWWNPVDSFTLHVESCSGHAQQHVGHEFVGHEIPNDFAGQCALQVLRFANALGEPALGSTELPTLGSANHKWGTCKPCAFLYKRGCQNGVQCDFCHLCDEGEKKRRQKGKIARLKEMRGGA